MTDKKTTRGRKTDQKMKPYLVMQYLIKHTDENNIVNATDIAIDLFENYGILAERRSIYKDIQEIYKAVYML